MAEKDSESNSESTNKKQESLGKQCAAWGCFNRGFMKSDGKRVSSGISFFHFPKAKNLKKIWCNRIKRVDGKDNFKVTTSTVLCEQHFKAEDIIRTPGGTRKRLRDGATPYLLLSDTTSNSTRKEPSFRPSPRKRYHVKEEECTTSNSNDSDQGMVHLDESNITDETDWKSEFHKLKEENKRLQKERKELIKVFSARHNFINYISSADDLCNHYTGIATLDILNSIFSFLNPGEFGENIILYNNQEVKGGNAGRPRILWPFESFVLTLVRLRRNFDIQHMSYLFNVSEGTITNTVVTWINFMYIKLGSICIWPTKKQVTDMMPKSMKEKFANVRCIIDCVEFKVAVPSALVIHKMMYSDYKSHTTVKVLVGIAPGGGFTFISTAFPGSISDKSIVIKSGLLYPELWEKGDAIMADRGFLIDDYLKPLGVELIIPAFLKGRDQFTGNEVVKSQQIAAERIHVERMIQRLKCFHIFDRVIPVNMLGSLNQVISVCGILSNFQEPILKKKD